MKQNFIHTTMIQLFTLKECWFGSCDDAVMPYNILMLVMYFYICYIQFVKLFNFFSGSSRRRRRSWWRGSYRIYGRNHCQDETVRIVFFTFTTKMYFFPHVNSVEVIFYHYCLKIVILFIYQINIHFSYHQICVQLKLLLEFSQVTQLQLMKATKSPNSSKLNGPFIRLDFRISFLWLSPCYDDPLQHPVPLWVDIEPNSKDNTFRKTQVQWQSKSKKPIKLLSTLPFCQLWYLCHRLFESN